MLFIGMENPYRLHLMSAHLLLTSALLEKAERSKTGESINKVEGRTKSPENTLHLKARLRTQINIMFYVSGPVPQTLSQPK